MTQMSDALLLKLKESLQDEAAAWAAQSIVINKRTEQTLSGSGTELTTTTTVVNNDSYRMASSPLNLMLVFLAEYTPEAVRSISVVFNGVSLTTTDQELLNILQGKGGSVASSQDQALLAALTLPA